MKLRVKRTGRTIDVQSIDYLEGDTTISIRYHTEDGYPDYYDFESLKEMNDTLEDCKPAEPLIKDEKVRKAVRAWADANKYDKLWVYHDHTAISFYNEDDDDNEITFNTMDKFGLDHLGCYTIAELCGEKEEPEDEEDTRDEEY